MRGEQGKVLLLPLLCLGTTRGGEDQPCDILSVVHVASQARRCTSDGTPATQVVDETRRDTSHDGDGCCYVT